MNKLKKTDWIRVDDLVELLETIESIFGPGDIIIETDYECEDHIWIQPLFSGGPKIAHRLLKRFDETYWLNNSKKFNNRVSVSVDFGEIR